MVISLESSIYLLLIICQDCSYLVYIISYFIFNIIFYFYSLIFTKYIKIKAQFILLVTYVKLMEKINKSLILRNLQNLDKPNKNLWRIRIKNNSNIYWHEQNVSNAHRRCSQTVNDTSIPPPLYKIYLSRVILRLNPNLSKNVIKIQ